jgi:predicted nucleotide-binding protein
MNPHEELFAISKKFAEGAALGDDDALKTSLELLDAAATAVGRSFSGSWLGYHSRVYYKDLQPPPAGANFSQEWGLKDLSGSSLGSKGAWRQFDGEDVNAKIRQVAENPDLSQGRHAADAASVIFDSAKSDAMSILETAADRADGFINAQKSLLEIMEPKSPVQIQQIWSPKGQIMTRDTTAAGQGTLAPPHVEIESEIMSIRNAFDICRKGSEVCARIASHMERKSKRAVETARIGTNVFIGHGRSALWRELKDFIQDRLKLPWDEFNRVPVAGLTNITRLAQMLDSAAVAFLVMTAEDEMADGAVQARMNVVHEAGLFQGRLGFTKAILLVEEGCTEFSNVQGLGQIRFPKGKIDASFEEIRKVVEREGLLG